MGVSPPPDLDALSSAELKALVIALLERVSALERTVTAQRDEIARLKTVPGRPKCQPIPPDNYSFVMGTIESYWSMVVHRPL